MKKQGPLTEEQEKELAKLQPKAQTWQKNKENKAERYREKTAAAARVAELEGLKTQRSLTSDEEKELAKLQPKAAQVKQETKEYNAKQYQARKAAVARVEELEALARPLTERQAAELEKLQPKAQTWQKQKENKADWYRVGKAAAARVAVLEGLKERGRLTEGQGAELAALRPKAQTWQKEKERWADWYRVGKAAAVRVAVLEGLKERGRLTEGQGRSWRRFDRRRRRGRKRRKGGRIGTGWERLLPPVLRCWRRWRSGGS